jgi:ribosomal protein S27E
MYRQINKPDETKSAVCPECGCKQLLYTGGKVKCRDCGHIVITKTFNKYGAKRTVAQDGIKRDSKYEASVADSLYARKLTKDIKDYDSQYRVECWAYDESGKKAFCIKHKVDFRIHHNDGSFELLESKGVETSDYRWRRKCLEELWLPFHKDHIYTVIKQSDKGYKK